MGHLAGQTMAGCRLMSPDVCRRWLPVWLPGVGGRGAAGALRLITVGQVTGTLQVTHRRQGSLGGPADETVRSGTVALAYLPPQQARAVTHLAVEYFGEQYPVTVAVAESTRCSTRRTPGSEAERTATWRMPRGHSSTTCPRIGTAARTNWRS